MRIATVGVVGLFLLAACSAPVGIEEEQELVAIESNLSTPTGADLIVLPRPPARVSSVFTDDFVAPFAGSGATFTKTSGKLNVTLGAAGTSAAFTVDPTTNAFAGSGQTELTFAFTAGTGASTLQVAVEDDDAATVTTWVSLSTYLASGVVTIPMSALNPAGRPIRRLLIGKAGAASAKFTLDDVRFSWTDPSPTELVVYADAIASEYVIDGWDSSTAAETTYRSVGTRSIKGTYKKAWSAITFTHDWSLPEYPAGTHTTVSFDISPGASSVPAGMTSMLLGLDGDPQTPMTSLVPGGFKANTWHRVTVPVASLVAGSYRQVTFKNESTKLYSFFVDNIRFQTDHAAPALRVTTPPPTGGVDPAVFGPTGCAGVTRVDRTLSGKATDQYGWRDRSCGQRSASLVRSDTKGGHALEVTYPVGSATRTVGVSPEDGAGGFGYVVSHLTDANIAYRNGADDSPLGSSLGQSSSTVFKGAHHALHQYTVNYPRWGRNAANTADVRYDMPVTIQWLFETGRDAPIYSITYDLSAAPANAVSADMRAPYGAMNFDGTTAGNWGDVIGGVAWAEKYKFTSLGNGLTLNSGWTWNELNAGPAYNSLWTKTTDAEQGIVATHVLSKMDAGGYNHGTVGRGTTSAAGYKCTSDDGLNGLMHTMPCASDWSFQSVNWAFWDSNGNPTATQQTGAKRITWGSDWGTLGQSSVTTVNGNVVTGSPKVSYATFLVFDTHSKTPTTAHAAQVSVINATAVTATAGVVRTTGPAGVGRTDTMTYSPAGYSPVLSTWEIDASATSTANLDVSVGGTSYLENPTFVIHGFTKTSAAITLDGTALSSSQVFTSLVGTDLWVTLNAKLRGTGHKLNVQ